MQLIIAEQTFEITKASLFAFVIDPEHAITDGTREYSGCQWNLELSTYESMSFWHDDIRFPNVRRWKSLSGQSVNWTRAEDHNAGSWYGAGILGGNCEILESTLHVVEREGCKFQLRWTGFASKTGLGWEPDPQDGGMSFEITCTCIFQGVGVLNPGSMDEQTNRALIARYLELDEFEDAFEDTPHWVPGYLPLLKPRC